MIPMTICMHSKVIISIYLQNANSGISACILQYARPCILIWEKVDGRGSLHLAGLTAATNSIKIQFKCVLYLLHFVILINIAKRFTKKKY